MFDHSGPFKESKKNNCTTRFLVSLVNEVAPQMTSKRISNLNINLPQRFGDETPQTQFTSFATYGGNNNKVSILIPTYTRMFSILPHLSSYFPRLHLFSCYNFSLAFLISSILITFSYASPWHCHSPSNSFHYLYILQLVSCKNVFLSSNLMQSLSSTFIPITCPYHHSLTDFTHSHTTFHYL